MRESDNWDGREVVMLRDKDGNRIDGARLPHMGELVELKWFDGNETGAARDEAFEPGCGWVWSTGSTWIVPGHPLIIAWRPIVD